MNLPDEHDRFSVPGEERLLDRLVDGELSDAEQRALLQRFENEPANWRRCALAFLEAQTWREAFSPLVASAPTTVRPTLLPDRPRRSLELRRRMARLTGLAAGLAVAFALGWAYRGGTEERPPESSLVQGPVSAPKAIPAPSPSAPATVVRRDP